MTTQVQQLTLGGFDLFGDGDTWRCETLADGTDLSGNPQPVDVAIQSLIQDGSVSFTEKYDNATITIVVCLSAPDAEALDDGAAALFAELAKPNVLTYEGPLAFGAVAWDVVNSRLDRTSDDLGEIRGQRFYTVTLTVLPFRRATEETITPALATGSNTVNIADGASTSGWTGFVNGGSVTPTVVSGAVRATTPAPSGGTVFVWLEFTGSITTSSTKYLVVDWATSHAATPEVKADGLVLMKIAEMSSPTAGFTRTYYYMPAASVSVLRFYVSLGIGLPAANGWLAIDNLDRTDAAPGTAKQRIRTIQVGGSARTPGTIAVEHETAALGDVFAYFWPDDGTGYTPMMRQYRTAGVNTADTPAAVTGIKDDIKSGPSTFDIPAAKLPRDTYTLYVRLKASSLADAAVTWRFTTLVNGVDIGPVVTSVRTVALTTDYAIVALGAVELPTRDLEGPSPLSVIRCVMSATSSATSVYLDEAWIVGRHGREVLVSAGTGTPSAGGPSNRVWIDAPTLANPRPRVLRGFAADRSDAFHPSGLSAWKFPEMVPDQMNAMVVTTGAADAATSFRHYERKAG